VAALICLLREVSKFEPGERSLLGRLCRTRFSNCVLLLARVSPVWDLVPHRIRNSCLVAPTAAAESTARTAAAADTLALRPRFVHCKVTAIKRRAVQRVNRFLRLFR
jgi:hypothetical protein